ncbi:uncharacterized protein [Halyomorpha halys]|uniref:uncharacterized protein isoform X2 n=1 Tax=Halyomorpha halys TaxID=286706 RepID=UPI0006D51B5A|nr:uncharacterized protein LOC106684534 isoform X2 [Halyomorpha halys]
MFSLHSIHYGGGGRRWGVGKPMVTPVHRFQHIDSVTSQPQSSRQTRPPPYNVCREPDTTRVEVDSSVYLESPAEPHHSPPVAKFRCGMWASFALATVFVAGAKFYFDHQGTGLEVLVTCTVLVVLLYLVAGCTLSICRTKSRAQLEEPPTPPPVARIEMLPPPVVGPPPLDLEAPPPPYHIAVSLPHHSITPPPSYEKAVS